MKWIDSTSVLKIDFISKIWSKLFKAECGPCSSKKANPHSSSWASDDIWCSTNCNTSSKSSIHNNSHFEFTMIYSRHKCGAHTSSSNWEICVDNNSLLFITLSSHCSVEWWPVHPQEDTSYKRNDLRVMVLWWTGFGCSIWLEPPRCSKTVVASKGMDDNTSSHINCFKSVNANCVVESPEDHLEHSQEQKLLHTALT